MALVAPSADHACWPNSEKKFVLPFGKQHYYVPASAVLSLPKRGNKVPDGKALGIALGTKAPEKWFPYCDPDCLILIQGNEGTSVYTTFDVPGHPEEVRFLRHIGTQIAEKVFKEWRKEVARQIKDGEGRHKNDPSNYNERQKTRYDVLNWSKAKDCPQRAQLHPELNSWTPVSKEGGDQIKSCKIDPVSKTRPKGPADKRGPGVGEKRKRSAGEDDNPARCDPEKNKIWEEAFKVGPKGSYSVHENNGILYIIQYKYEGCDKESAETAAAAGGGADGSSSAAGAQEEDEEEDEM